MKPSINSLLNKMRDTFRPGQLPGEIPRFIKKLNADLKVATLDATATFGGSVAKGTSLKDFDVDIFVLFGKRHVNDDLSTLLEQALHSYKLVKLHGSRDYFQVMDGYTFEIVPVLKIRTASDAKNITDFSPLHVKWVKDSLKKNPMLADDIRLAKQFCKANLCYGAESYISGFSGHVLDILVIHYGSFVKLLKAASAWKPQLVVDHANFHKGKALFNLNKSKIGSLIVIDPLQSDRNAAAALSVVKFERFITAAKEFLKSPSEDWFMPVSVCFDHPESLVVIEAVPDSDKRDVAGARLRSGFDQFVREAEKIGFSLRKAAWAWSVSSALFILDVKKLPSETYVVEGPLVVNAYHAERFKRAHKGAFIKSGKLFAKEKRVVRTVSSLYLHLCKMRIDGIRIIKRKNPQKSLCVHKLVDLLIFKSS